FPVTGQLFKETVTFDLVPNQSSRQSLLETRHQPCHPVHLPMADGERKQNGEDDHHLEKDNHFDHRLVKLVQWLKQQSTEEVDVSGYVQYYQIEERDAPMLPIGYRPVV